MASLSADRPANSGSLQDYPNRNILQVLATKFQGKLGWTLRQKNGELVFAEGSRELGVSSTGTAIGLTKNSTADSQDLLIQQLGDNDSSLRLEAQGTSSGAIAATTTNGGITLTSANSIILTADEAATDAIQFTTTEPGSGVTFTTGSGGVTLSDGVKLNVDATTGDAIAGIVTLTAGTATVPTTSVTSNSVIIATYRQVSGATTAVKLEAGSITSGASFVINSVNASGTVDVGDTSVVSWFIMN